MTNPIDKKTVKTIKNRQIKIKNKENYCVVFTATKPYLHFHISVF